MLRDLANGPGALEAQLIRKDSELLVLFDGIPGKIETREVYRNGMIDNSGLELDA